MSSGHLWINEKRYNKSGRVGGKTLIGNWREEQRLDGDLGIASGTIVDTNRKGAESTPFLLSSVPRAQRSMVDLDTEQQAQFNQRNSDVTLLRPAKLGVRSMLRAQDILSEARQFVAADDAARRRPDATPPKSCARDMCDRTGVEGPPLMRVDPFKTFTYLDDRVVTLYTGDPTTGETMHALPGRTAVAPGAPNPHAKNHGFTMDKYVYALSRA